MSTVNAVTIVADEIESATISTGNVVTLTVTAGEITVSTGNVTANSTVLKLDNTTAPINNTTINTTAVSAASINLNSVQYTTIAPSFPAQPLVDYQVFTANGTWFKPPWAQANDIVTIMAWGGGGGGALNAPFNTSGGGGGGGACVIINKLAGECNSVCNVVVGLGGASSTSVAGDGGNSIFWTNSTFSITAYGGQGANTSGGGSCGAGGGWFGKGSAGVGGGPLGGAATSTSGGRGGDSTFGGGGGSLAAATATDEFNGGASVYGGGGGARYSGDGGNTVFGGGGGCSDASPLAGRGISIFGGNGGRSSAGVAPGGGGGTGSAGARGEVRITTIPSAIGSNPAPIYSLTPNTTLLYEGNTILFTVSTLNVANGTTLYYTLNNSSTAVRNDFTGAVNGSIVINGGSNTFTLTANNDSDGDETFYMDLRTGSSTGTIVANSATVSLNPYIAEVQRGTLYTNFTSQTTHTAPAMNIGTATSTRVVIALIAAEDSAGSPASIITSATIGGIAATIHSQNSKEGATASTVGIISAVVPTGTTASVAVTFDRAQEIFSLNTVAVDKGAAISVHSTASTNGTGAGDLTTSLDVIQDSFVVSVTHDTGGGSTFTWSGATEWYDTDGTNETGSGAILRPTATQSNYSITSTSTQGGRKSMATVCFK